MNRIKRTVSLLLCALLLCGSVGFGASALEADDAWQRYWQTYSADGVGMYMAPGADETERNISWYADADTQSCRVAVSESADMSNARTFSGTSVRTPEGDLRCKTTVHSLWPGKTYYYKCATDKWESETYSFSTLSDNNFTAMYVTDIHVSLEDDDADSLMNQSYTFSRVLEDAAGRGELDLVISAGDQASRGYRSEYTALVASPVLRSTPFALCPGNHDRKGIAYRTFTDNPNEDSRAIVHSLIARDYYYVKGDALFFVFDSNVGSMTDHRNFVRRALRANPDVKWRVAVFHHDLYGGRIERRESENKLLRAIWAPIFDEFRFDLVLLGHSHYYTISNAVFKNRTNQSLAGLDSVTDPAGTVVMVSGSINRPRSVEDGEEPPVGENVAYAYLSQAPIYNLLDFTEDSVTVRSYELGAEEAFHTFTIAKTSAQGGHPANGRSFYDPFVRFVADVYGFFNEVVTTARFRLHWNDFVGK
ncbi:MAG: metallophosphoesterase [Clostridia bacterium]|nr:metallophosphoesterase [Clostridia bacterium]